MAPDPHLLLALAGSANLAAQHAEHVAFLIRWAAQDVALAEGGETLERCATMAEAESRRFKWIERTLTALVPKESVNASR